MKVQYKKFNLNKEDLVDVLNVKIDDHGLYDIVVEAKDYKIPLPSLLIFIRLITFGDVEKTKTAHHIPDVRFKLSD